jgi:hypothetical protein
MEGTKAMSDTPETDAAVQASGGDWSPVLRAVAQRLERERDELKTKYDTLAVENMLEVNKLCKERDEAREQVDRYRDKLDLLPISWEL